MRYDKNIKNENVPEKKLFSMKKIFLKNAEFRKFPIFLENRKVKKVIEKKGDFFENFENFRF